MSVINFSRISNAISGTGHSITAGAGCAVKIVSAAVDSLGPETQVAYASADGTVVKGFWSRLRQAGEIEQKGSSMFGGPAIGPKPVRLTFGFDADQVTERPTVDDHLVEPNDTNWQIIRVIDRNVLGALSGYILTVEQIWPLP